MEHNGRGSSSPPSGIRERSEGVHRGRKRAKFKSPPIEVRHGHESARLAECPDRPYRSLPVQPVQCRHEPVLPAVRPQAGSIRSSSRLAGRRSGDRSSVLPVMGFPRREKRPADAFRRAAQPDRQAAAVSSCLVPGAWRIRRGGCDLPAAHGHPGAGLRLPHLAGLSFRAERPADGVRPNGCRRGNHSAGLSRRHLGGCVGASRPAYGRFRHGRIVHPALQDDEAAQAASKSGAYGALQLPLPVGSCALEPSAGRLPARDDVCRLRQHAGQSAVSDRAGSGAESDEHRSGLCAGRVFCSAAAHLFDRRPGAGPVRYPPHAVMRHMRIRGRSDALRLMGHVRGGHRRQRRAGNRGSDLGYRHSRFRVPAGSRTRRNRIRPPSHAVRHPGVDRTAARHRLLGPAHAHAADRFRMRMDRHAALLCRQPRQGRSGFAALRQPPRLNGGWPQGRSAASFRCSAAR
ncbi:hypothetical protein BN871_JV_00020 [Paenibacillus sp. P22]|nr:hypothetical protein BN871_JV_00020 [Paenibacillus sp. P22]